MHVMYQRRACIDVYVRFLVICRSYVEAEQRRKEICTFRQETADLLAFRAWLVQERGSQVGMESTGVYWMAVYRRLGGFFELVVANAEPHQNGSRSENGCPGCGVDCRLGAARSAHCQLCTQKGGSKTCEI